MSPRLIRPSHSFYADVHDAVVVPERMAELNIRINEDLYRNLKTLCRSAQEGGRDEPWLVNPAACIRKALEHYRSGGKPAPVRPKGPSKQTRIRLPEDLKQWFLRKPPRSRADRLDRAVSAWLTTLTEESDL